MVPDVVDLSDGEPDAVVIHPQDLSRYAQGHSPPMAVGSTALPARLGLTQSTLWGLACRSGLKVLPRGTAIVGDLRPRLDLFVRPGRHRQTDPRIAIKMTFCAIKLTFLGEGRFGLAVWRPDSSLRRGSSRCRWLMVPHIPVRVASKFFRPRGREGERCWFCMGLSFTQHVADLETATCTRSVPDEVDQLPAPLRRVEKSADAHHWRSQFADSCWPLASAPELTPCSGEPRQA